MFLTADTTVENQHTLTLNQNDIDVQWLMSSHLIQCNTLLYEQNVHIRQHKSIVWESECIKQAAVDQQREQNWHQCLQKQDNNISIVQNEGFTSCQLRDTYLYDTYMMIVVVVVVVAELVIWESVLTYLIKKDFTYKRCQWRSWRRKKREVVCEVRVYNSLHWQISSSELLKKITQAMKNFHLQTLPVQSRKTCVNRHWQSYNNLFRSLKHNLEERERWCHELNSY
jgi:hypothetical protein